jgi:hypothetical protein
MTAGTLAPERAKAAQLLAALAWLCCEGSVPVPPGTISSCIRVCSRITDAAERLKAWAEYRAAVRIELDLDGGVADYRVVDDELTCADRMNVAIEIARQRSAEALAVLLGDPIPLTSASQWSTP